MVIVYHRVVYWVLLDDGNPFYRREIAMIRRILLRAFAVMAFVPMLVMLLIFAAIQRRCES